MILNARRRAAILAAVASLILIAVVAALLRTSQPRYNVLLITLDTTRADRLGCYGHTAGETKVLDALAAEGVVFNRCYAPAPLTLPSHASILTGLHPPEHGLHTNGKGRLPDSLPTLATVLDERGYRTGAFVASFVLDSIFGLDRGFEQYDDDMTGAAPAASAIHQHRSGDRATSAALQWLSDNANGGFFCWVHLYDPHSPYDAHAADFGDRFQNLPYDGEIAFVDQQCGRLLDFLRREELLENTLVIVAGDHGESLGEHDEQTHGYMLHNATLQVPLIVAGPGIGAGRRVPEIVRLIDLAPTILDWLGWPGDLSASGRSLVRALHGEPLEELPSYGETDEPYVDQRWSPLRSLIAGDWKFIKTTRPELYNLADDPRELVNLIEKEAQRAQDMDQALGDMIALMTERQGGDVELTPEQERALASLGYVGTGTDRTSPASDLGVLPDVKDMIRPHNAVEAAKELKPDESIKALGQILSDFPDYVPARCALVEAHTLAGQRREALRLAEEIVKEHPQESEGWFQLGTAKSALGRDEEAIADYQTALKIAPDSSGVNYSMGMALLRLVRPAESRRYFEATLRTDPGHVPAHVAMGIVCSNLGDPTAAREHYAQALRFDSDNMAVHSNLAALLMNAGELDPAETHFRAAVKLAPENAETHYNLGLLMMMRDRPADAVQEFEQAVKLNPRHAAAAARLKQARSSLQR